MEVDDLVLGEDTLGEGVETERLEEGLVDGVHTLLLAGGGEAGSQHEILGVNAGNGVRLGERQLVLGQGTGLVGAENLDTSQGLDGGELLHDGLLAGEVGGTDGHGGGDDSGQTDGHTDDGNSKGELEDLDDLVGAVEGANPDDQVGEDNQDQEDSSDTVKNFSEVTASGGGGVDEGGGATNEGVVTGGANDDESLTTLDGGRGVALVALVLVDGERLTGDGGLIDLKESIVGDDAAISGDNGTFLNLQDITGNDFGSLDLLEGTITQNNGLEGKSLLQLVDDGTGLVLLDETDSGVKQKQTADDTEINPVLKTRSQNSGGLKHQELARFSLFFFAQQFN